ncbi:hypothetical protein ACH4OW_00220 [Streptomyces sp. NPDC017056]|uniref:hypothetical protein n=1 Tax=Streptomyces sp. NPDC017056 TaxID=3364973 RepID=UPI003788E0D2
MGWVVLYIAFGCVALWLLGEVLLQYKARLRWRLLAFTGFLGVVVGVVIPSVVVIAVGAVAFAVGQTYVTLSFRSGFSDGWALRGKRPGKRPEKGRRRARGGRAAEAGPTLQVSDLEAVPAMESAGAGGADGGGADGFPAPTGAAAYDGTDPFAVQDGFPSRPGAQDGYAGADSTEVYAPQPLPDETGQYGIYSPDARTQQPGYAAYDGYGQDTYGYDGAYGGGAQGGQDPYADHYGGYGSDQGQQAPYSDPYIGTQQYAAPYDPYEQHDAFGGPAAYPGPYPGGQDTGHGQASYGETPPGGVWVPQQRGNEPAPDQLPYPPYQAPQDPQNPQNPQSPQQGFDGQQYRY